MNMRYAAMFAAGGLLAWLADKLVEAREPTKYEWDEDDEGVGTLE